MEEKLLNFNRPLLSVRRFTSREPIENESKRKNDNPLPVMPRPPRYKSELKSGPVTHPGTVPFLWETIPGKPRDETEPQIKTVERPPTAPKLPPGRALKAHQQCTDKASANPSADKNQVGRKFNGDIERIGKVETESLSSGDDDEAYVDARDTLSRIESFSLNCSVSGLSGFDGLDINLGNSPTDQQSRDIMMGRFLPAAKAMASETTSQNAPWKRPIVRQQPKQVQEEISGGYIFSLHMRSPTTPLITKRATSSSSGSWSEFDNEIKENESKVLSGTIQQNPVSENSRNDMEKLSIAANVGIPQSDTQTAPAKREKKLENYSEFLIPPPLPKSPTDSWLGRTLPTMSAKNASRHRHLGNSVAPKYQLSKPKSSNPKWETIVKTTNQQHQRLRFSEERLKPISEA